MHQRKIQKVCDEHSKKIAAAQLCYEKSLNNFFLFSFATCPFQFFPPLCVVYGSCSLQFTCIESNLFFFSPWMSFLVFPRRHKNQSEKKRTQLYTKRAFMCSGLSSFKTLFLYSGSRFMRPTTCMRFPFAVLSWDGMFQQRNNRPLPNNTMNKRAIKSHKGTCGEIDEFRSYEPFY